MFLKPVAAVLNGKPCVGGENRGLLIRHTVSAGDVGGVGGGGAVGVRLPTSRKMMFSPGFLFHRTTRAPPLHEPLRVALSTVLLAMNLHWL